MNTERVIPTLDQFEAKRWSPEVEAQRDTYAAEQFVADTPQFYRSPKNSELMLGWLAGQGVPITRRNLAVAFRVLLADGVLESCPTAQVQPEPPDNSRGVQKMSSTSTVKLHHTCPDTPLNRAVTCRRNSRSLLMVPDRCRPQENGVGTAIQNQHSRGSSREGTPSGGWLEARAKVAMEHANVKRDSVEFNRLVVLELEKS